MAGTGNTVTLSDQEEEELLRMALANLEQMAYIGIMEQYEDSMLLLKRTFPDQFHSFTKYVYIRENGHTSKYVSIRSSSLTRSYLFLDTQSIGTNMTVIPKPSPYRTIYWSESER